MEPLVSIVIPSYNHERFVRQAVASCLAQSYESREVIIIDDGSKDNSVPLLNEAFGKCKDITIISQENRGAHDVINRGIRESKGDYIAILNSDDIFMVDRIEKLVGAASEAGENARNTLFFSNIELIDDNGDRLLDHERVSFYNGLRQKTANLDPGEALLIGNVAMTTSNFFFHKALYEKIGPFSPLRYCHDWDWALRVIIKGKCMWLRESLLNYRVHCGNTITEGDIWKHIQENAYAFGRFLYHYMQSDLHEGRLDTLQKIFGLLLQNDSFLPIPVLIVFICHLHEITEDELLAKLTDRSLKETMSGILGEAGVPLEVMLSTKTITNQDRLIGEQGQLLEERWAAMQQLEAMVRERDTSIISQGQLLEERWAAMQQLEAMVRERDDSIISQGQMLEERWAAMQQLEAMVCERDETIRALEQRWFIFNKAAKLKEKALNSLRKITGRSL